MGFGVWGQGPAHPCAVGAVLRERERERGREREREGERERDRESEAARAGPGPAFRKVDVRLPGKGNGARPGHLITTMIKWIRTSRLSIKHVQVEVLRTRAPSELFYLRIQDTPVILQGTVSPEVKQYLLYRRVVFVY